MSDPFNINVIVGKNIRFYREQKGWTLEKLAEESGYEVNTKKSSMSKIENGKNDIPTSRLYAIAKALGVDITDLIREDRQEVKKRQLCDLFEQCYGKQSYAIVQKFIQLDAVDQGRVEERIDVMLESDKYTEKEKRALDA